MMQMWNEDDEPWSSGNGQAGSCPVISVQLPILLKLSSASRQKKLVAQMSPGGQHALTFAEGSQGMSMVCPLLT